MLVVIVYSLGGGCGLEVCMTLGGGRASWCASLVHGLVFL